MLDLDEALDVAIEAAQAAGEILKSRFKTELKVSTKTSARDLVTEVDGAAQAAIVDVILNEYPDHGFITEEVASKDHAEKFVENENSPFKWIIDPLDGTTNFVHGKPEHGTAIALSENDELILGVIFQPSIDRLFSGAKGKSAFVDGSPVVLRDTKGMVDAVLCTCLVERGERDGDGNYRVKIPDCGSVHNYGCASYELGAVLLGQNDGAFFENVGFWDIAAGCLLISEAGGKHQIELDKKDPRRVRRCTASTEPIFDELCNFIIG